MEFRIKMQYHFSQDCVYFPAGAEEEGTLLTGKQRHLKTDTQLKTT